MNSCPPTPVQRGFGLIELMIAMTLGLILILGVAQVFLNSKRSFVVQQQVAVLQENARFLLTRISRDVRQAGVFGCLDLQRLPTVTRSQLPAEFAEPLQYEAGVLRLLTAVSRHDPVLAGGYRSAAEYDAQWLLASNCLDELRIASGSTRLSVTPEDVLIPVRQLEYRLAQHSLQARINGTGNFETLIDGVAAFDVQFGLAGSATERAVADRYRARITPAETPLVRSVRIRLELADSPDNPGASQVKSRQYTLVTAMRNRLD